MSFTDTWKEWGEGKKILSIVALCCVCILIFGFVGSMLSPDQNTSSNSTSDSTSAVDSTPTVNGADDSNSTSDFTSAVDSTPTVNGADDLLVPSKFEVTNADDDIANYDDDGLGYHVHLMIVKSKSLDDAVSNFNNIDGADGNLYTFFDDEYGDIGYDEVIQVDGTYYYVSVYTMGGHFASYSDNAVQDIKRGINYFNALNHAEPIAVM